MDRSKMKGLGASDMATIMGLSPYQTRLQLWARLTGRIEPKDLSENQAVEWGKRLERVVSEKFSDAHDVKLMAYKKRYTHPEFPFISCELDNIIVGTEELVEIKTVGARAWKEWADQEAIPQMVIVQVMTQLGLTGRKVGWIACLCGGQQYIEKKIEFNQELYDAIIKAAVEFWQLVETDVAPDASAGDSDTLVEIYPNSNEVLEAVESLNDAISQRQSLQKQIDDMTEEKKEIENQIKAVIGEKQGVKTSKFLVTWKQQTSMRVDTELLKAAMLYDKFTRPSSTRVLRITLNKDGAK